MYCCIVIIVNFRSLEGVIDELRSDLLVDGVAITNVARRGKLNAGLASIDHSDDEHNAASTLPGAGKAAQDSGSRITRPDIHTSVVAFSSTGREWAAATTQGLQASRMICICAILLYPTDYICNFLS